MDVIFASLQPLVDLTNTLLDHVVQPNTLDYLVSKGVNVTTPAALFISFQHHWPTFLYYFLGFIVIASIGVLIAVVLPITGICICFCRSYGHCGGGEPHGDHFVSSANRKEKVVCELLLFVLGSLILAGGICSLFANQLLRNQTASGPSTGAVYSVSNNTGKLEAYFTGTSNEAKEVFRSSVAVPVERVTFMLNNLAEHTWDHVSNASGAAESMDTLAAMVSLLDSLYDSLTTCDNATKELRTGLASLDTDLEILRNSIKNDVALCSATRPMCAQIAVEIDSMKTCADYQGTDAEMAMVALGYALQGNITETVTDGKVTLENSFMKLNDTLNSRTQRIVRDINRVYTSYKSTFDVTTDQLDNIDITQIQEFLSSAEYYMNEYGMAFYIVIIITSCLIILIAMSYFSGMALGICKGHNKEKTGCSRAKTSTGLLLLGNGMAFAFGWIMLILVTIYFVTGGVMHTEACRNLQVKEQTTASAIVDQMASNALGMPYNLFSTSKACEANVSIYNALQLDSQINNFGMISSSDALKLRLLIRQVNSVNLPKFSESILTPKANETLHFLPAGLGTFNSTAYKTENSKPLTCLDLEYLATNLDAAAAGLTTTALATKLRAHATNLRQIQATTVSGLTSERNKIKEALITVEKFEAMPDVTDVISDVTIAQYVLNNNGKALAKAYISSVATTIYNAIINGAASFASEMKGDVGRCRPVYDVTSSTVDTLCYDVVDMFNIIWLTQGWALILLLPAIIIVYRIVTLYIRTTSNAVADAMTMNILSDTR